MRVGVGERLRLVSRDARLAVGAALGVVMVLIGIGLALVLAVAGTSEPVGLVLLAVLVLMGGYVVADALGQATRVELPPGRLVRDSSGLYGQWVREPEPNGPRPRPLRAVVVVLLMVLVGPFVIAVPLAWLGDQHDDHPGLVGVAVPVLLVLLGLVVRLVVGRLVGRRRD
ncbi:hypothetical protein [Nocardioides flavescens]|uniref:Uncharacterized protein n=1 Tax=Nocardioides flavescens TaxID=2691959 RepID=A0A6L7F3U1_9ACTN|nr:hypothetical protein [Nocardioides flavescens]MXG91905.1 hypothetical protein [Nocardioides flavescens]